MEPHDVSPVNYICLKCGKTVEEIIRDSTPCRGEADRRLINRDHESTIKRTLEWLGRNRS